VVQRAAWARVLVDGVATAVLGRPPGSDELAGHALALPAPGLLCLVGVARDDTATAATALARRIFHLRVLDDDYGRMGASVAATGG
jgi:D-Tyr-tRNAtyr deacylase